MLMTGSEACSLNPITLHTEWSAIGVSLFNQEYVCVW